MDANHDSDVDYIDLDAVDIEKPKNDQKKGLKLDGTTLAIGLVFFVAALIILPRLFDSGQQTVTTAVATSSTSGSIKLGNVSLSQPVASTSIDEDGCPIGTTNVFLGSQDIYVVAVNSSVPNGTGMFVRLYHDGRTLEDAPELVADRDYTDVCVNFVFEPVNQPFEEGNYEAQFIVNGNPGPSVTFSVANQGAAPAGLGIVGLAGIISLAAMVVVPRLMRGFTTQAYDDVQPGGEYSHEEDPNLRSGSGASSFFSGLGDFDDSDRSGGSVWRRREYRREYDERDNDSGFGSLFGGLGFGRSGGSGSSGSSTRHRNSSNVGSRGSFGGRSSRSSGGSGTRTNSPNVRSRGSFGGRKK